MNRSVFSIILLTLIVNLCVAGIVVQTSKPKHLQHLHDVVIDILMTCYGDPGSAVAIIGDSDGSILKTLRSKYFIPVVLINHMLEVPRGDPSIQHELQVFVIVPDSFDEAQRLMDKLRCTPWWNRYASFLFIDAHTDVNSECSEYKLYAGIGIFFGVLNAQSICYHKSGGILLFTSNPFTSQAPPVWTYIGSIKWIGMNTPTSIFGRRYRKGGQACEALNFEKTINVGGMPFIFYTGYPPFLLDNNDPKRQEHLNSISNDVRAVYESVIYKEQWLLANIARNLNVTVVIVHHDGRTFRANHSRFNLGVFISSCLFSSSTGSDQALIRDRLFPLTQEALFAATKYTEHMSQLDKIFSVVDGNCRMGMWVVYLITFVFFKFCLGQAVIPALLNLVRLTCNTGITKLPAKLAPKIYLTCLLMFVVTLQGIYTGNLATLLTTTIAYRNLETKLDIPKLGYKVYRQEDTHAQLAADPVLSGHIIEIPQNKTCLEYVLKEPLAACVENENWITPTAVIHNLHVSREPIAHEYIFYLLPRENPLARRLDTIMKRWAEHGVQHRTNKTIEKTRIQQLYDDEVKKNTDRRVMTLHDLCFAFVILGVGLLCSFVCFIGEIVICKVRLKIAKRRKRVRARLAWGVKENPCLSFPSLNLRLNVRRLFTNRR